MLVDIRRFPSSRTFPHFNRNELSTALQENDIEYRWIEELGGRQPKRKDFDSPNSGLRNDSFRNYADSPSTSPATSFAAQRMWSSSFTCTGSTEELADCCLFESPPRLFFQCLVETAGKRQSERDKDLQTRFIRVDAQAIIHELWDSIMLKSVQQGRKVIIADGSHAPYMNDPGAWHQELLGFLRELK